MAQDCSLRSIIAYLFVVVASVLALTYADRHAGAKEAAGYSYVAPQVAPPVASRLSMAQLDAILNETAPNTPYLVAYQLKTTDAHGAVASAAPLKVVPTDDPARPYLGVFHNPINTTQFATYPGYSNDLKTWHTLGETHQPASQPDIRILADDSVLYAEEYNPSGRPYVSVQYYGNAGVTGLQAFIANPAVAPTNALTLPGTPSAKADGTPEFGRVNYSGSISSSRLEITHHNFHLGQRDLEQDGTLTDFKKWSDSSDTIINDLVSQCRRQR